MSHSVWEVIRRSKAKVDAAKNAVYTRHSRAIIMASRNGDPSPDSNFTLRTAIEKARDAGLPNENIERAIKKGSGQLDSDEFASLRYEGYGPGGVAVLMEILTDNRNRTAAVVREAFTKTGGSLGETGCVSWMFAQKGVIRIRVDQPDEESLLLAVAEAGGDDFMVGESITQVVCDYASLESVSTHLRKAGYPVQESSIQWLPQTKVSIDEPQTAKQVLNLMDRLDNLDDVQNVFANFEIEDSILETLPI